MDDRLTAGLNRLLGGEVEGLRRLSGGASRETWAFDLRRSGGRTESLILRRDPPGAGGGRMALEARLLAAAASVGIPVPAVREVGEGPDPLGAAFLVMERVEGETIPRRILRDPEFARARPRLATQCGEILARLHSLRPDDVGGLDDTDQLAQWRSILDAVAEPHPTFELAFRWLAENRPPPATPTVVHGDFRNGNLVVGAEGIRAVLDWELAHAGDPLEDLGWLCVKSWRFGVDLPVGGFGTYDDLCGAYAAVRGVAVDPAALRWWETMGTLKWGIMCILQAMSHLRGAVRSIELAAIGRRVCEVEWDLLELLFGPHEPEGPEPAAPVAPAPPHDVPSAESLTTALAEFIERDVVPATEGRLSFHARVAANVAAMVARELALGPAQAARHAAGLARLGLGSEHELAAAIREGSIAPEDVLPFVTATVRDKLLVANPRHLRMAPPA